jgi:hypothetical protein
MHTVMCDRHTHGLLLALHCSCVLIMVLTGTIAGPRPVLNIVWGISCGCIEPPGRL